MSFEDRLIEAVRSHSILYDTDSPVYKNKIKKQLIWAKIGNELRCSAESCQKRWRSLRDRFSREIRKIESSGDAAAEIKEISWLYFYDLMFLKDYLKPPKAKYDDITNVLLTETKYLMQPFENPLSEATSSETLNAFDDDEHLPNISIKEEHDELHRAKYDYSPTVKKPKINNKTDKEEDFRKFLTDLKEMIGERKDTGDNENMLFMKSIALKMDEMPKREQRKVQMEILSLVNKKMDFL